MKKIMLTLAAVALTLPLFAGGPKDKGPAALKVISYNIRVGTANDGTNSWQYRYPASAMMIMDQKPDIFGLQEALDFQVKYLEDYCDGYKGVGVGRDDGRHEGEQMSIFYNTRNIKLLKWGTYWLSETPEKPSLGWDAVCKRTATWALMKDKRSGRHFYFINTHLDHKGKQARINGLQLIMDRIAGMNPEDGRGGFFEAVSVKDLSVVTSGSYERCLVAEDGHVYSHILDPATGRSIENNVLSVSVIGKSSAVCDALSTAFFVLGPEGAQAVLKKEFGEYYAVFLLDGEDGRTVVRVGNSDILE